MRIWLCILSAGALLGQVQQPLPRYYPTNQEKEQIYRKLAELTAATNRLEGNPLYPDVAIYQKAGDFIVSHPEEFIKPSYVKDTLTVLDDGIARAKELSLGSPSWSKRKGRLIRAYQSTVDGSLQPYGLIIPNSYSGSGQPARLDIWMHGTNRALDEVEFITQHESAEPVPDAQNYIQMDVYGRSNVSYRWAGEADVFEALAAVQKQYNIDPKRIALRGFSMGGAGAWHLGLHHPDAWAVFEAGAGYTETKVYAKKDVLPPWQEQALHYYDAVDYSLNATDVPFVGYGGSLDPQLQGSKNIQAALLSAGINPADLYGLFLAGPGVAHKWEPETHKISEHFVDEAIARGATSVIPPAHIRFETWTTRFNRCFWVTVEQLHKSYERATVDALREGNQTRATTTNVDRIRLDGSGTLSLDGQQFPALGAFERTDGKWAKAGPIEGLRKIHALQGPVDDTFMESFLCVRPTGTGTAVTPWSLVALDRFQKDFSKWLRGDPHVKDDKDVTPSDIANNNLILFGDPWSNQMIAKVIDKLPIRWTKDKITLQGRTVDAATNAPVLIFPNPLNPNRYVVINSGHTFSEDDWRSTNANLYPHLRLCPDRHQRRRRRAFRLFRRILEIGPMRIRPAALLATAFFVGALSADARLPGKGMAQHPFLYCGEWQHRSTSQQTMYIVLEGKVVWAYTNPLKGELGDCTMLGNGDIVFSRQFGASEITPAKKIVWNYDGPAGTEIHTAWPMISGNQHGYVREVDPAGETVWEINKDDLPGIALHTVQEVSRLANGNTLINNWVGDVPLPDWPTVVQLIEVTPDKKVAWALRDWRTLGPASSTQLLDDPGIAEKQELQR